MALRQAWRAMGREARGARPKPPHIGPSWQCTRGEIMTKTFGRESTTDEVLEGVDLRGKRILVTGVSAGLGVETARALAAHGATVVGAARDLGKAEAATRSVREEAAHGGSL